jgi:hypothetical protein
MEFGKKNVSFRVAGTSTRSASPRICMPTWRNFTRKAYRCGLYEAQDILVDNDDVDTLVNTANTEVYDYQQHRNLFANMAKRSRYFVVAAAKMELLRPEAS